LATDPIVALGLVAHTREDSTGYGSITEIAAYTAEIYLPLPDGPIYSVVLYAPTLQRRGELLAGIASIRRAH